MSRALVLGGGGVTGIAWELGVIAALREVDVDVAQADLIVGTSAGATVGAQITSGAALDDLIAVQLSDETTEIAVDLDLDLDALIEIFSVLADESIEPDARRAKVGAVALATDTITPEARRAIVAARLPEAEWPDQRLIITAVDATSGAFVPITRDTGMPLIDAVTASCAVPGIWPPAAYDGRRFLDGGVRSSTNADLAEGLDTVLVLTPMDAEMTRPLDRHEVPDLEASGSAVAILRADEDALTAIGPNPLDPARRRAAYEAGRRQGEAASDDIGWVWTS
jgi:NTE family protein